MGDTYAAGAGVDAGVINDRRNGAAAVAASPEIHGGGNPAAIQLLPVGIRFGAGCGVVRRGAGDHLDGGGAAGGVGGLYSLRR